MPHGVTLPAIAAGIVKKLLGKLGPGTIGGHWLMMVNNGQECWLDVVGSIYIQVVRMVTVGLRLLLMVNDGLSPMLAVFPTKATFSMARSSLANVVQEPVVAPLCFLGTALALQWLSMTSWYHEMRLGCASWLSRVHSGDMW